MLMESSQTCKLMASPLQRVSLLEKATCVQPDILKSAQVLCSACQCIQEAADEGISGNALPSSTGRLLQSPSPERWLKEV